MEDVPVKIVERYKPPPAVYQLPQAIVNRLQQHNANYFQEQPEYHYDFHLERQVLEKAQRWRQQRQQQQDARQARQERRKQERQRVIEAQQKEMLGAVEYPSAAELSSDDEGEEDEEEESQESIAATKTTSISAGAAAADSQSQSRERDTGAGAAVAVAEPKSINSCNFNTILQPTVLSGAAQTTTAKTLHKRNSSLNYADFEYNMNSTPFDIIELKTINDLDILAQVLHQTQLKAQENSANEKTEAVATPPPSPTTAEPANNVELSVTTLAETKATLDSVNFQTHCDDIKAENIPSLETLPTPSYAFVEPHYNAAAVPVHLNMGYNREYFQSAQVPPVQHYNNQNYLMGAVPLHHHQHQQQQQQQQLNYVNGFGTPPTHSALALAAQQDAALKSKSVPDILRELKIVDKRRARNHSHNPTAVATEQTKAQSTMSTMPMPPASSVFRELASPAQILAQHISSMGFPLERVANVVRLCGVDDKKIIEHLIPLSELMDLGFDESKISAALLKFNNNKEKALDYLIN